MKKIQIPLYPRKLWLIDDPDDFKNFTFVLGGGNNKEVPMDFESICDKLLLMTHAVIDNETGDYGVMVYFNMNEDLHTGDLAHESVHVVDYVFDELGMYSQCYQDGNEPYAYLIGWVAQQLKDYYDDRREQEPVEA